jgi:hypothetical protein
MGTMHEDIPSPSEKSKSPKPGGAWSQIERRRTVSDDFEKGMRGDSQNISNYGEYNRGEQYQRDANAAAQHNGQMRSPHGFSPMVAPTGTGPVITGENAILQTLVSVPFLLVGTLLYPVAAVLTLLAALLCARLLPLFGPDAGWTRVLAYVPMLAVFWFSMRWEVRAGERYSAYRRGRSVLRLVVFAVLGFALAGALMKARNASTFAGLPVTLPSVGGAIVGVAFGYWMLRHDGWHDFWERTLAKFRILSTG